MGHPRLTLTRIEGDEEGSGLTRDHGPARPAAPRPGSFPCTEVLAGKGRCALRPCPLRASVTTGRRDGGSGDQATATRDADGDVPTQSTPTRRRSDAHGFSNAAASAARSPTTTTCLSARVTAV